MIRSFRCLMAALCLAGTARAADLQVSIPTVTAPPGATVIVPISVSPSAAGFGLVAMDFVLPLDANVLSACVSRPDGMLNTWGPPFVSATASQVAAAAAGLTPVAGNATLLNTLELTIRADAVLGTDLPLVFTRVRFNEGSPSVELVPGLLRVRATVGVGDAALGALSIRVLGAQPTAGTQRLALTLPREGRVSLALYDVHSRPLRTLLDDSVPAGGLEVAWDGRDASGRRVPAGVVFARLRTEAGSRTIKLLRLR